LRFAGGRDCRSGDQSGDVALGPEVGPADVAAPADLSQTVDSPPALARSPTGAPFEDHGYEVCDSNGSLRLGGKATALRAELGHFTVRPRRVGRAAGSTLTIGRMT